MESNACFFLHYMPFLKAVGRRADARTVMGWWCGARTVLTSGVANFTQPYRGLLNHRYAIVYRVPLDLRDLSSLALHVIYSESFPKPTYWLLRLQQIACIEGIEKSACYAAFSVMSDTLQNDWVACRGWSTRN
jgi:hypothetical protein